MAFQLTRETYQRNLRALLDEVLALGSMAEQAVMAAVEALRQRDLEAAQRIYSDDQVINEKRYQIENEVITLIATQQPMAGDLRLLAAILEIITELERIADYAKGISKISLLIGRQPVIKVLPEIPEMAELAGDMLHRSLLAFVNRDVDGARQIPLEDDTVDRLYNQVYQQMLEIMLAAPSAIDRANYLVWVAHNLERMADRVTNICERIIFVVTGDMIELDQPILVQSETGFNR